MESPQVSARPQIQREIILTAALHSLQETAKRLGIRVGVDGGMGLAGLYRGNHGRRRYARNLDIEIPQDVSAEKLEQLFHEAGLNPPKPLEDVYLPGCAMSRNTHKSGQIDVLISRLCPSAEKFDEFSANTRYSNHVIDAYGLPTMRFRQLTPAMLIAGKARALADPNRALTIGKMDDIHDLIHVVRTATPAQIERALHSGFFGAFNNDEFRANLETTLGIMDESYSTYQKWFLNNSFVPHAYVTEHEWHTGIRKVRAALSARGFSPITAIRLKIQLAPQEHITEMHRAMYGTAPGQGLRSGILAREIAPRLQYLYSTEALATLACDTPSNIARAIANKLRQGNPRKRPEP